jgi:hypothetical protein
LGLNFTVQSWVGFRVGCQMPVLCMSYACHMLVLWWLYGGLMVVLCLSYVVLRAV